MNTSVDVSNVRFTVASEDDALGGLLGYVSLVLNDALRLDGITLRQTADGRLTMSYPSRTDRFGYRHYFMRPLSDVARREIERQTIAALHAEVAR